MRFARLIGDELEQRHMAGYLRAAEDADEIAWTDLACDHAAFADDVDWAVLSGSERRPSLLSLSAERCG